jgi:phosphohistidine swiveling domain-containing protein
MIDEKLAELMKTQKSLTEWLDDIQHSDTEAIRHEDNEKRERLKVLNEVIGLPFDKPTQFDADELRETNKNFVLFLEAQGEELCALRLIPKKPNLPKLRMRGLSIKEAYSWFKKQEIDPEEYRADFIPHCIDSSWATIFIVNKHGIQGEIIFGGHHQLTQGFHDTSAPLVFRYDFKSWQLSPSDEKALEHLKKLAEHLHVPDVQKQKKLSEVLGASFVNGYLTGYFETQETSRGIWFIDYSQSLGNMFSDTILMTEVSENAALVRGKTASSGKAKGEICIVDPNNLDVDFPENGILVCSVTTPNFVPLMKKASAIVTDQGGILSHAAIVARELHKPCIVGTGNATEILRNNQIVSVDADAGTVKLV